MPDSHLTADQAMRFQHSDLDNEELTRVLTHLDECPQCREQYLIDPMDPDALNEFEADLLLLTWKGQEHLSFEQIIAIGEGSMDAQERQVYSIHLQRCDLCRAQVERIRTLHAALREHPARVVAPLSQIAIQDTSGRAVLEGDHVRLEGSRKLPAATSGWVRKLLTAGIIAPFQEIDARLSRLKSASISLSATLHAPFSLLAPVNTAIRSLEPALSWQAIPNAEDYSVVVMQATDRTGRQVWQERTGRRPEVRLPAELNLETNHLFVWQVTAIVQGIEIRSDLAWFFLLSADAAAEVAKIERAYSDSALIRLAVCAKYGLYDEAQAHLQRLKELNAENALMRRIAEGLERQRRMEREPRPG